MNFATGHYLVFINVVFFGYWHLSRRAQNLFLLAASYYFYSCWDWRFLSLIVISTLADYVCGPRIYHATSPTSKKAWLIVSLVINLGLLCFFKYFNFFADSLAVMVQPLGWHLSQPMMNIVLPVGISFYTFQTLSYSIDIYRGDLKPTKSLIDFAAFVAFFPQLVAGPIVRAREFIYQLEKKRYFSGSDLEEGLTRFLFGFFKKTFIADTLGVYLVDPVFANAGDYTTGVLWLAMVGYTAQIYADFSGYSSMAIGSARILGFRLPENFKFPLLSCNYSLQWRRWHMTMTRFFADYVFRGLGGSRDGRIRTLRNLAATMFLSGLWHGAGWTYVVFGILNGIYIAVYHVWSELKHKWGLARRSPSSLGVILAWFVTQLGFVTSTITFRSVDLSTAWVYLKGIVGIAGGTGLDIPLLIWVAIGAVVVDHLCGWALERKPEIKLRFPVPVRAWACAAMVTFIYHTRPADVNPFIYFQF